MQLNSDIITRGKEVFEKYYSKSNAKIFQYYLLAIIKHLIGLGSKEMIYMFYDNSYKVSLDGVKKYKEFEKELGAFVEKELKNYESPKNDKVNL